jgi:hypothetical protein
MKIRKLLNFVAPALAVGLILVSQAQGSRVSRQAPTALTRALEAQVDLILARVNADNAREQFLINAQLTAFRSGNMAAVRAIQGALNRNAIFLQADKNVLIPIKDRDLAQLSRFSPRFRQVSLFVTAATQQERYANTLVNFYLARQPLTPQFAF